MEVHHHSQHKAKKFKEHFIEFLMLFLAVTLGFIAENLRDQYVEQERSEELLHQLKKDVINNMHLMDSVTQRDKTLILDIDKGYRYLISSDKLQLDSLYQFLHPNIYRFLSKNDTYEQMKSSGSLRYIKDAKLLEKILVYSNDCMAAEARSTSQESDFVKSEYNNMLNKWMPVSEANKRYLNTRLGRLWDLKIDSSALELLEEHTRDELIILSEKKYNPEIILSGEALKTCQKEMAPVIMRRGTLLINTVKFMATAKYSGEELVRYLEKEHQ